MNTPTFPRGTLSVGELFSATIATYRAKFGLFLALGVLPAVVWLAVMLGVTAWALADYERHQATPGLGADLAALGVLLVVMLGGVVASAVMMLPQLWTNALTSLATRALASGHRPTLGEVLARNRGFAGRAWVLILAMIGLGLLSYGMARLPDLLPYGTGGARDTILGWLSYLIFVGEAALLLVMVRLVYVVPVMAIERASGMAALRRAWELTRGVFLPTLGALAVSALFVGAVAGVASSVGFTVMVAGSVSDDHFVTPTTWTTFLIGQTILIALLTPFGSIYIAGMYVNRLRQLAGEPPSAYFRHPGGPAQPGRPPYPPPAAYPPPPGHPQGWTPPPAPPAPGPQPGSGRPPA